MVRLNFSASAVGLGWVSNGRLIEVCALANGLTRTVILSVLVNGSRVLSERSAGVGISV